MRRQLIYFTRPLRRQPRQHVLQIRIRIMTIQPRRPDHEFDPVGAAQRAPTDATGK
jgi:hypothetical protein